MFRAFSNAVGGMIGFAHGLNVVSNNIANMRVPGFRRSDAFFRSVSGDQPLGMRYAGESISTRPGEFSQTGVSTHLALGGSGFFVLRDRATGELRYTRVGDFLWKDNVLIDRATKFEVMARNASGDLVPINTSAAQQLPGEATTTVNVSGSLPAEAAATNEYTVKDITVYNAEGVAQKLRLVMKRDTVGSAALKNWQVAIYDANNVMVSSGWMTIAFGPDNKPMSGQNTVTATLGGGVASATGQVITFNFGGGIPTAGGTASGVSLAPGAGPNPPNLTGALTASAKDGFAPPTLQETRFDADGILVLKYSDGKEIRADRLVRASFSDETALRQIEGGLFQNDPGNQVTYGYSGEGPFGELIPEGLEGANVDLVMELGRILEIQRGYGACSRVMSIADEMIQQAISATRSGNG